MENSYIKLLSDSDPDHIERIARHQSVIETGVPQHADYIIGLCTRLREGNLRRCTEDLSSVPTRAVDIAGHRVLFAVDDIDSQVFFLRLMDGDQIHEPGVAKYLAHRLKHDSLFVDVGAHIGYLSCIVAALGAAVLALEIQKPLIPLIERNARLNQQHRVHALNVAAGARDGLTGIMRYDATLGAQVLGEFGQGPGVAHNLLSRNLDWIPIVRLDTLFAEREEVPDIVKIDVEGAELQVLSGATKLLKNGHTRFLVEYHVSQIARFDRGEPRLHEQFPQDAWKAYHLEDNRMVPLNDDQLAHLIDPEINPDSNPTLVFEPIGRAQ